jgi:MFS family permease
VTDRAVGLVFTARFVDEVLSGAWVVLAPTFRAVFRLSLVQLGLLSQVCNWVALGVEPLSSAQIDLRPRRWLMLAGAVALAASVTLMGVAPGYGVLVVAFAVYGIGSGPLVLTADVLVVESFPKDPGRAYSRSTFLDTLGALVGPALVAVAAAAGVSWRVLLVGLGVGALGYAVAVGGTPFPLPPGLVGGFMTGGPGAAGGPGRAGEAGAGAGPPAGGEAGGDWRRLVANARTVVRDPNGRRWLLVLLCFDLFEAAFVLKYVWLHDSVGLSQPLVALWASVEQLVDLTALALLDRWLARRDAAWVFRAASAALLVLPAAWVAAPGVAGRVALGIPLAFAYTLLWPLAKSESLSAVPEMAGATQAIAALFPLLPLALLEAQLATALGIGVAMAATATAGAALMLVAVPRSRRPA